MSRVVGRLVLDTAYVASALPALSEYASRAGGEDAQVTDELAVHVVLVLRALSAWVQSSDGTEPSLRQRQNQLRDRGMIPVLMRLLVAPFSGPCAEAGIYSPRAPFLLTELVAVDADGGDGGSHELLWRQRHVRRVRDVCSAGYELLAALAADCTDNELAVAGSLRVIISQLGYGIGAEATLSGLLCSSQLLLRSVRERDVRSIIALAAGTSDRRERAMYLEYLAMLCAVDGQAVPSKQLMLLRLLFEGGGGGGGDGGDGDAGVAAGSLTRGSHVLVCFRPRGDAGLEVYDDGAWVPYADDGTAEPLICAVLRLYTDLCACSNYKCIARVERGFSLQAVRRCMSDMQAHPRTRAAFCRLMLCVYIEKHVAYAGLLCLRSRVLDDYATRPPWYSGAGVSTPPLPAPTVADPQITGDLKQYVLAYFDDQAGDDAQVPNRVPLVHAMLQVRAHANMHARMWPYAYPNAARGDTGVRLAHPILRHRDDRRAVRHQSAPHGPYRVDALARAGARRHGIERRVLHGLASLRRGLASERLGLASARQHGRPVHAGGAERGHARRRGGPARVSHARRVDRVTPLGRRY